MRQLNKISSASTILQMLLLYWLTICTPFVFTAKQKLDQITTAASLVDSNPQSGTQEEKCSSNIGFSEEFLHDHYSFQFAVLLKNGVALLNQDTFSDYKGEPLCPPPNFI